LSVIEYQLLNSTIVGSLGIELVEEWGLEALTMKTIDLLDKRAEIVELPRIKSWEEIMSEEVGLLLKLVRT